MLFEQSFDEFCLLIDLFEVGVTAVGLVVAQPGKSYFLQYVGIHDETGDLVLINREYLIGQGDFRDNGYVGDLEALLREEKRSWCLGGP